jgi:outer membrane receptor protein involved in Fe transport
VRGRVCHLVGGLLLAALSCADLQAQVPTDANRGGGIDSVIQMDAIVVSVSRSRQRLAEIPSHVTVLTRREIERAPVFRVDDLLRQVPGFNLLFQTSSTVSHPTTQTVSLRGLGGLSSSRTLVLLDGVPIHDPFSGWVPWSLVPLEEVERIEVVHGGGAGVWGNLALGGVIHLISREEDPSGLSVSLRGGGQSTVDAQMKASGRAEAVEGSVRGRVFRTGGYPIVAPEQRGAIDRNPTSRHVTVGGRLHFRTANEGRVFLRGIVFSEEREAETALQENATDIVLLQGGAELPSFAAGYWQLGAFAWIQSFQSRVSSTAPDRNSETPAVDQFDVPGTALGGSAVWTRPVDTGHRLSAGVDLQWLEAEDHENFAFSDGAFRQRRDIESGRVLAGAFLSDAWEPIPEFHLLFGGRLDSWRNYEATVSVQDLESGEIRADDRFRARSETALNGNAGLRWEIVPELAARGAVYRSFRAPTESELYRPFRAPGNIVTAANDRLDPERLVGVEGGLDLAVTTRTLARITGFWNRVDKPIFNVTIEEAGMTGRPIPPCGFVPAGGVCRERRNVGAAVTRGLEGELEWLPNPTWRASASYLYDQTEVVEAPDQSELVGKWIRQAPRHQLVMGADYASPMGIDVLARGRYVGERFDDDRNTLPLDDFFVLDLRIGYRFPRGKAYVGVENLFDAYAEAARTTDGLVRTASPRLFLLGIEVGF